VVDLANERLRFKGVELPSVPTTIIYPMADYASDLTPSQRVSLARDLILQAPPGEVNDVVNGKPSLPPSSCPPPSLVASFGWERAQLILSLSLTPCC
jgi:hypothetical protein